MSTVYDWVTVLVFISLLALYFLRLERRDVPLSRYVGAAAGCAAANYLGNHDYHVIAFGVIAATLYFAYFFIVAPSAPGKREW